MPEMFNVLAPEDAFSVLREYLSPLARHELNGIVPAGSSEAPA